MASSTHLGLLAVMFAALAGGATSLACSAAPTKAQTLVVDCEPGTEGCRNDSKKKSSGGSGDEEGTQLEGTPTGAPETTPKSDAGAADGAADGPTVGPACAALALCCDKLKTAGITGSANQCVGVAAGGSEYACSLAHTDYKTPGDDYDPVCE